VLLAAAAIVGSASRDHCSPAAVTLSGTPGVHDRHHVRTTCPPHHDYDTTYDGQ
jgi:hypothetical protein